MGLEVTLKLFKEEQGDWEMYKVGNIELEKHD